MITFISPLADYSPYSPTFSCDILYRTITINPSILLEPRALLKLWLQDIVPERRRSIHTKPTIQRKVRVINFVFFCVGSLFRSSVKVDWFLFHFSLFLPV